MWSDLVHRVRAVCRRKNVERELENELEFHVARQAEKYLKAGLSEHEATRRAHLEFGGLDRAKEEYRDALGTRLLDTLIRDVRHSLRTMGKNPGFTLVAVLSLAVGIGANSAIFSLIDQLLIRTLPVDNPQELVQVAPRGIEIGSTWGSDRMSYPMYEDFRDRAPAFSGVLAWHAMTASFGDGGGQTERIRSELITGDYFQILGVSAAIGRTFTREDNETLEAEPFVMLTYDFWRARFGGDPSVVGRTIYLSGHPMTIIGVSAQGFHGLEIGEATQVFVPMMMQPQVYPVLHQGYDRPAVELRRNRWVSVFARLKPGVTAAEAQVSVAPLFRQIIEMEVQEEPFAEVSEDTRQQFLASQVEVFDGSIGRSVLRTDFTTPLYVLIASTALVLLIACANVANLLVARATSRQREIAVRLAIGASRTRIVTQLMVESLLLSVTAAIAGLQIGVWMNRSLLQFLITDNAQLTLTAALDGRVVIFLLVTAFMTAFIFGLAPALQATKPHIFETLKNAAGNIFGARGHARLRKTLVTAQVSLSLLLVITSSLFVRSLQKLHELDPGFRKDNIITFSVDPALNGYTAERTVEFNQDLLDRLRRMPGVTSVGHAVQRVLDGNDWRNGITVEGYTPQQGERVFTYFNMVGPGYFGTLGIQLLAGREFEPRDLIRDAPRVCIVNEAFVRKYFPNGNALGSHVGRGSNPETPMDVEIIGIVGDTKYDKLRNDIPDQMFAPNSNVGSVFYVRTAADPAAFFSGVRSNVSELDATLPLYAMRTLEEQIDRSLLTERMVATLSSAFGSVATLLAVIGLYGVMSFTVAQRAREIGIRVSLGAQASSVLSLMMREVVSMMLAGIAIAIPAYMALSVYIQSQLYGIQSGDPAYIAAAALFLFTIGLIAGYIPSRRALRVDPIRVLRYE